ncbi:competence type IV pilus minor pilin ComGF [Virgibacillus sp. W0181]|uniref:competence type IV pilus minor pilin ComGF n=1 Tax=Virgibacillus sp. W0181 TaxID=3391581 RepID=UPI003F46C8E4
MGMMTTERGFTLVHYLLLLTMIAVSLPLMSYLIKSVHYPIPKEEMAMQTFVNFVRDDIIRASTYHIQDDELTLELHNGKEATISQYKNTIRRRVDLEGHEIYLMNVENLSFSPVPKGFRIRVTSIQGETYEKSITFYK